MPSIRRGSSCGRATIIRCSRRNQWPRRPGIASSTAIMAPTSVVRGGATASMRMAWPAPRRRWRTSARTMHSALYIGLLRHRRHRPRRHAFTYPVCMVMIDLAERTQVFRGRWFWSATRPALAWLRRADYLGDPAIDLHEAVRRRVHEATGQRPAGPIRMLTHLRSFGHCFNPVTFYYCLHADGERLDCILAEITNTPWRERHSYVLPATQALIEGGTHHFAMDKARSEEHTSELQSRENLVCR